MKKVYITVIAAILFVLFIIGMFLYERLKAELLTVGEGEAVSIIGGADGPTTVFLAGKLGESKEMAYKQITMEEAKEIFNTTSNDSYIVLDVRRQDEYESGHIPGAINVANESIGMEAPAELPDRNQVIYVYCRSGNRSKQAADKLAAIGYTNIIEFGGIMDWTGAIE